MTRTFKVSILILLILSSITIASLGKFYFLDTYLFLTKNINKTDKETLLFVERRNSGKAHEDFSLYIFVSDGVNVESYVLTDLKSVTDCDREANAYGAKFQKNDAFTYTCASYFTRFNRPDEGFFVHELKSL